MTEDKLATMPVGRLLAQMSLPIMVSFFIQALYNFVDSMFVAQLSEQALTATSLAFPMQQISHAIAVGTGIGMAAVIPKLVAKNEREQANQAAHTGILSFFNLFNIRILCSPTFISSINKQPTNCFFGS